MYALDYLLLLNTTHWLSNTMIIIVLCYFVVEYGCISWAFEILVQQSEGCVVFTADWCSIKSSQGEVCVYDKAQSCNSGKQRWNNFYPAQTESHSAFLCVSGPYGSHYSCPVSGLLAGRKLPAEHQSVNPTRLGLDHSLIINWRLEQVIGKRLVKKVYTHNIYKYTHKAAFDVGNIIF